MAGIKEFDKSDEAGNWGSSSGFGRVSLTLPKGKV
jgi:hypothetical protein